MMSAPLSMSVIAGMVLKHKAGRQRQPSQKCHKHSYIVSKGGLHMLGVK